MSFAVEWATKVVTEDHARELLQGVVLNRELLNGALEPGERRGEGLEEDRCSFPRGLSPTIILGFLRPLVRPPGGWKGGSCPKLLSLYFLGKSDDNKNATFQNAVFPVL